MKPITTKQASKKLNMTVLTIQTLMQQEMLPIGYAVKREGKSQYHYIIFDELVDSYIKKIEGGEFCKG